MLLDSRPLKHDTSGALESAVCVPVVLEHFGIGENAARLHHRRLSGHDANNRAPLEVVIAREPLECTNEHNGHRYHVSPMYNKVTNAYESLAHNVQPSVVIDGDSVISFAAITGECSYLIPRIRSSRTLSCRACLLFFSAGTIYANSFICTSC